MSELLSMKKQTYKLSDEWRAAFGEPERNGVWFVWGRSGSGKTSFVLKLCKELCRFGKVAYDSLEEGSSLTMKNAFIRAGMQDVARRMVLLDAERMEELDKRLVIISQAEGTRPKGRTAVSVMYDAALKIWVEGYRAISKGRYFGEKGYYPIWAERAEEYWTNNDKKQ